MATRRELIDAIAGRYHAAARRDKKQILDEFIEVTNFHRKHAIRVLRKVATHLPPASDAPRTRIYDEGVLQTLTLLWEAADRICGKRLKAAIPALLDSMERHGHLKLDAELRRLVLAASAATIDRMLACTKDTSKQGRRKQGVNTPLRKGIAVRTFTDWNDPPPGFFEMDMVAHCGKSVAGSHVHSLVLTDIASAWTIAAPLLVREQTLIIMTVEELRRELPFPLLGLDVDNDSAFINSTLLGYCRERGIELTRSRAYKKNDQAWIEQKNGSVVRRMVGYGRLEGMRAVAELAQLHRAARLYVNFFCRPSSCRAKSGKEPDSAGDMTSPQRHMNASWPRTKLPTSRRINSDRPSLPWIRSNYLAKCARHRTGLRNSKRALHLLNRRRPILQSINLSGISGQLGSRERFVPLTGNGMRHLGPGELAKILLKVFGRPSNNG
ncbi:MAG TPA: hypothetical protein VK604_18485 [Bryobacteraceae bacterium]|nr:hypothetical protein [Bryobacteraceae bacterium]